MAAETASPAFTRQRTSKEHIMTTRDMPQPGFTPRPAAPMGAAADTDHLRLDPDRVGGGPGPGEAEYVAHAPLDEAAIRDRQPKGDHNRRLALGLDVDAFALEAGITPDQLREYEQTWPDHDFDLEVARRIGLALERLEADPPASQKVDNGPSA
jgi:hypothetical protein